MRRQRHSTIGLGAALVVLLGQAAALAHLALVEHRRCPAHGETVHAAAIASPTRAPTANVAVAATEVDGDADAADDHCLAAALTASSTDLPHPTSVPATVAAPAPPGPLPVAPAPPLALLRLAPKHGPPRAPVPA